MNTSMLYRDSDDLGTYVDISLTTHVRQRNIVVEVSDFV